MSFGEWMKTMGLLPKDVNFSGEVTAIDMSWIIEAIKQPIPEDTAQKIGLKPKARKEHE